MNNSIKSSACNLSSYAAENVHTNIDVICMGPVPHDINSFQEEMALLNSLQTAAVGIISAATECEEACGPAGAAAATLIANFSAEDDSEDYEDEYEELMLLQAYCETNSSCNKNNNVVVINNFDDATTMVQNNRNGKSKTLRLCNYQQSPTQEVHTNSKNRSEGNAVATTIIGTVNKRTATAAVKDNNNSCTSTATTAATSSSSNEEQASSIQAEINSDVDNDESRYDDVTTHGSSFDDDCFVLNGQKTARNE